jgi:hypothetical protein
LKDLGPPVEQVLDDIQRPGHGRSCVEREPAALRRDVLGQRAAVGKGPHHVNGRVLGSNVQRKAPPAVPGN